MDKTFNEYICIYKEQLTIGDIQKAYMGLIKYVMSLKAYISKKWDGKFSFGNASLGYLNYTYFPFSDTYLRNNELRFGLVLNHREMRFELWLMGRNADVQRKYWDVMKASKWNEYRLSMPQYSVLEVVIVEDPDFDNLTILTQEIEKKMLSFSEEIIVYLRKQDA